MIIIECVSLFQMSLFPRKQNINAYEKGLYMRIKLNDIDFTANLDTGSGEYIEVDSAFYEKHQKEMPIGFVMKKNRFGVAMVHQARIVLI